MIVSCPSCDSKYQVADDKVAGNVLRTRCKACGSQILVDGTIPPAPNDDEDEDDVTRIMRPEDRPDLGKSQPPSGNRWTVNVGESDTRPMTADEIAQAFVNGTLAESVSVWKSGMANWAAISDVPELMAAIAKTRRQARPASTSSKPPAPVRAAAAGASASPRAAPTNGPSRTWKPPPPARASSPAKASPIKASPVVQVSKRVESTLDPSAPSGDFYSKLLNKVGASKSKPPAVTAEAKPVNHPRATMPPPEHDNKSVGATRSSPGRISAIKKEPGVTTPPSNLDPEAAPGDFYAKILAKVRPQKGDSVPPSDLKSSGPARTTLPPPTWGPIGRQAENNVPSHPPAPVLPSAQPVAPLPVQGLGAAAPAHAGEADAVDIPISIDGGFAAASQAIAPVRRPSPSPPKRPDPIIPVDIQLPPMEGSVHEKSAAGPTVVVSASTPPPSAETKPQVESKPGASAKPAPEVATDNTSPGLRAYRDGRRNRFAGTVIAIVTVGLLGVGGGVAATVYALKSSSKNPKPTPPAASMVASQPANSAANTVAPSTSAPPGAHSGLVDADELARSGPGAVSAQAAHAAYAGKHSAAHAGATDSVPGSEGLTATGKNQVPAGTQSDSNLPGWLEATADKSKNAKAAKSTNLAPAPAAKEPAKASGSPFNREAALAILGIAASQAPSCKRPGGPTGNGKALVTFDTDGQVVIANIVGDDIAGTPVARCVAAIFQRVKVAPFSGDRATVSKPFSIPP